MITVSNIVNASRGELLCITYQMLLECIKAMEEAITVEDRKKHLNKSLQILKELVGDLNFEYELAQRLFSIYVYVQGKLIMGKEKADYEEAYSLIEKLHAAYEEIAKEEISKKAVMENGQAIYAGLTYSQGQMNEVVMQNEKRGFKA